MGAGHDVRFRGVWVFGFLSVLLIFITPAQGAGPKLYTRTDEMWCGDTKVQAFTTCTDGTVRPIPDCTEQHFLFSNKRAGTSVKIRASGRPFVDRK